MADGGADLARDQLFELVDVADGAIDVLSEWVNVNGNVAFTVSLDTSRPGQPVGGIRVRDRERFRVIIPDDFPFVHPWVFSDHRRWARTPHVQWGSYLCLYAAPSVEWSPSDGMRGFIDRLSKWVDRAAAGTLDPDGQPLHPPAVYTTSDAGRIVVHPDLGDRVPWAGASDGEQEALVAWCAVNLSRQRVDVIEWVDVKVAAERAADLASEVFHQGRPVIVLPVILLKDELGFEYPKDFKALAAGLSESGYDRDSLLEDLASATHVNRKLRERQRQLDPTLAGAPWDDGADEAASLLSAMLVATPSRRIEGDTRLAHLAAWKLDAMSARVTELFVRVQNFNASAETDELRAETRDLAFTFFESSPIAWMQVMEMRPEVTFRRDEDTPANWLVDKRVLVLGAGALGGPVAESCLRAGVSELTVADNGVVTPGILVRQPYSDDDVGQGKAHVLARRLSTVRDDLEVTPVQGNVRTTLIADGQNFGVFDLVIDATADATVRAVVERARRGAAFRPPLVTMVIGHNAERGLVVTNLAAASGAGADAFRKVSLLSGSKAPEWVDIGEDFFPATPRTDLFFPEPGCSAPTFVGSAAQTSALAGMMLNEALTVLGDGALEEGVATAPTTFASAVRLGGAATRGISRARWASDFVQIDTSLTFEVRVSAVAMTEARAEVRRGARVRGPKIETGGMLLGAFDDATGIVYVDRVSGPPPDSYLSETYFHHGVEGTQERLTAEQKRTASATGFVGLWHSHPDGPARPSPTDEQGMSVIVAPDGTARRALMMILGGGQDKWATWRDSAGELSPDVYLRVVPRTKDPEFSARPYSVDGLDLQQLPAGSYFRGGYGGSIQVERGRLTTQHSLGAVTDLWSRLRGQA